MLLRVGLRQVVARPRVFRSSPVFLQSALHARLLSTPVSSSNPQSPAPQSSSQSSPSTTNTPAPLSPRLAKYAPRLASLADRTRVPLPSLVLSFLILHELTAIVPVVGLYYILRWLGAGSAVMLWMGLGEGEDEAGDKGTGGEGKAGDGGDAWHHAVVRWYAEGVRRAERVGRRYGVLGYEKGSKAESESAGVAGTDVQPSGVVAGSALADAVAAYVLVKALLPVRIAVSVGAAPAFARFALNPVQRAWRKLRRTA